MSDIKTVPLETADFLLGRMIATAKYKDELNKKIEELNEIINRQRGYLNVQGNSIKELEQKLANAPKRMGRPKGSKNKSKEWS